MASRAVTKQRLNFCIEQLLSGRPTSRLVADLATREGLSRRRAREYVAAAHKEITHDLEDSPIDKKDYLARMIASTEAAIELGIRDGHGHVVLGGVNTLSRLLAIGADQKQNPYATGHKHHG